MRARNVLVSMFVALSSLALQGVAQESWENPLKKTIREGKPVVGLTITLPSPDIAVQAAELGYDYVWIEMEHSPITLESARASRSST